MDIAELQDKLQNLTGQKISQTELGIAMGNLKRQTIHTRLQYKSEITVKELLNAQSYFNVEIFKKENVATKYVNNSFESQNDTSIKEKVLNFGQRLCQLQEKKKLSNSDFAKIIDFEEEEYIEFKNSDRKPNLRILNELKQHFKVSIDWLLYGE